MLPPGGSYIGGYAAAPGSTGQAAHAPADGGTLTVRTVRVEGLTPGAAAAWGPNRGHGPLVTEEEIYRSVSRLMVRGDARNGRLIRVP